MFLRFEPAFAAKGRRREEVIVPAFEVGNSFNWSSYGLAVTSRIYAIHDHARVLWGGRGAEITGIHEWLFAETLDGVRVTTNESFPASRSRRTRPTCSPCLTRRSCPGSIT